MKVFEIFRGSSFTAVEIRARMKNAKSKEEKAIWASRLPKETLAEESIQDYLKRLVTKHGIEKIGGGAYSQVFQHPELHDVAVKVFLDKDTGYKRFLKFCVSNKSNPYLPEVLEQAEHKYGRNSYNIVFLRKYTPIRTYMKVVNLLSKAMNLTPEQNEKLMFMYEEEQGYGQNVFNFFETCTKNEGVHPNFKEVWDHLKTYGAARLDTHYQNFMLNNGHLVFVDPVSHARAPKIRIDDL